MHIGFLLIEILPNILEHILYLIDTVICNVNVHKIYVMNSEQSKICYICSSKRRIKTINKWKPNQQVVFYKR